MLDAQCWTNMLDALGYPGINQDVLQLKSIQAAARCPLMPGAQTSAYRGLNLDSITSP
jgi:hypothetical protein